MTKKNKQKEKKKEVKQEQEETCGCMGKSPKSKNPSDDQPYTPSSVTSSPVPEGKKRKYEQEDKGDFASVSSSPSYTENIGKMKRRKLEEEIESLEVENAKLNQEVGRKNLEFQNIQKQNNELIAKNASLEERIEKQSYKIGMLMQQLEDSDNEKSELCSKNKKLKNKVTDREEQIKNLTDEAKSFESEKTSLGQTIRELELKVKSLEERKTEETKRWSSEVQTHDKKKREIERLNAELESRDKEHSKEIEKLNAKNKEKDQKIEELTSECDSYRSGFQEHLQKTEEGYRRNLDDANEEIKCLKEKHHSEMQGRLKFEQEKYQSVINKLTNQYDSELQNRQRKTIDLEQKLKNLKKEKEEQDRNFMEVSLEKKDLEAKFDSLQSRFSKMASQQLTANNPQIEDLGDSNRPMKVAEYFRHDLYGNEWCDVYEDLVENYEKTDKEAIEILLNICQVTFEYCQLVSQNQLQQINSVLNLDQSASLEDETQETFKPDVNDQFWQLANEKRKKLDGQRLENINQICRRKLEVKNQEWTKMGNAVDVYMRNCVNACWKMVIQDPPMVLLSDVQHDSELNKDLWDTYTIKGDKIDFLVWPAVLRHKDGPVLQRGIAEGQKKAKKTKKKQQEETNTETDVRVSTNL